MTFVTLCFFIIVNLMINIQGVPIEPLTMIMGEHGVPMMINMQNTKEPSYAQKAMIFTGYYKPHRVNSGQIKRVPFDSKLINSSENDTSTNADSVVTENINDQFDKTETSFVNSVNQNETTIQSTQDDISLTTQIPSVQQEKIPVNTVVKSRKASNGKKTVVVKEEETDQDNDDDEEENDDDNEEDDDDEELSSIVPFKEPSKRKNNKLPNFNNIFPMIFRFPNSYGRNSNGETLPELITAIANSYSTGKGGVASSVATAYGGPSSNGNKKKHSKLSNE